MWRLAGVLVVAASAAWGGNPDIRAFSIPGRLVFDAVPSSILHRVEWAASPEGPWSASWDSLNTIASGGGSSITCAVPAFFRVAALGPGGAPPGMAAIPAGVFLMGDAFGDEDTNAVLTANESPVHPVYVGAFHIDSREVTKAAWDGVHSWAVSNGFTFANAGSGKAADHPVCGVSWYDCVKWCNARSRKEGLAPCYTVAGAVYTNGQASPVCDWSAGGYRLPTEAEWERAARGGAGGRRFPWTDRDSIDFNRANYHSPWVEGAPYYGYDDAASEGWHPVYGASGAVPWTSPAGSFATNAFGLFDMAGNVAEWCWDIGRTYSAEPQTDPRGASAGSHRMVRGGGWDEGAGDGPYTARCAWRGYGTPADAGQTVGFRCVRRP